MNVPTPKKEEQVEKALHTVIHSTYKKLAASRYFTASHLEVIASEAKHMIHTRVKDDTLIGYYIYIKGVFLLCQSDKSLDQSYRRFDHLYSSLGAALAMMVSNQEEAKDVTFLLKKIIHQLHRFESSSYSPWPNLVQQLIPHLSAQHIEQLYDQLSTYTFHPESMDAKRVISYVSLLVGREREALAHLRSSSKWNEQQLTEHFRCLEQRQRWRTILQWLEELFPYQPGRYGSLQSFADKSQSQLNKSGELLSDVWDRWLMAPSFQRFSALTAHENPTKKAQILEYVLPKLKNQLHQSQSVQVYIKLLMEAQLFEKAAEFFLMYERNPLRLQDDKKQLLDEMKVKAPKLTMPVLHQFVVRLVEKKSRAHYEKAASYVKELKQLYIEENSLDRFQEYMRLMKSEYKTYRAFIKELNVIHA